LGFPFDIGYYGQGAHFLHSADVDGDGRDEVILGSSIIDESGVSLWTNGMGHCDHAYVGDIDPARPGIEIYFGYETPQLFPPWNGVCLADAGTGTILWGIKEATYHVHSSGLVSDIDPEHPGMECYSGEDDYPSRWLHAADGELIADETTFDLGLHPRAVYWDADPQRELLHGGRIFDFNTGVTHLEGIAGHQAAWADVVGDWREEIITSVEGELRIYTTTIPASDRRVCLMQDPIYRLDVAHLAMGYEQPPMTSFCLDDQAPP
jgi:rhamnogalacturonan endolyase